jgi:uncharacterized protein Smg (DUF494 family)
MKKEEKFLDVLTEVVNSMMNPFNGNIEKLEKYIVEKLVNKGYELHEIDDLLEEIFETLNSKKEEVKFRVFSPVEIINLSDEAKEYILKLKSDMIISDEEFEEILDEVSMSFFMLEVEHIKEILKFKGISENIIIN